MFMIIAVNDCVRSVWSRELYTEYLPLAVDVDGNACASYCIVADDNMPTFV